MHQIIPRKASAEVVNKINQESHLAKQVSSSTFMLGKGNVIFHLLTEFDFIKVKLA